MGYKHQIKGVGQVTGFYATDLSLERPTLLIHLHIYSSIVYRIGQTDFSDSDLRVYVEANLKVAVDLNNLEFKT